MSKHAAKGVTCLDCHQTAARQEKKDHHGFVISAKLTAGNCLSCHEAIYQQFLHSRHAGPSWAAVYGQKGLTPEQINFSEQFQPGGTRRPPNPIARLEGTSSIVSGCEQCQSVGRPNSDGTIGSCKLPEMYVTRGDLPLSGSKANASPTAFPYQLTDNGLVLGLRGKGFVA